MSRARCVSRCALACAVVLSAPRALAQDRAAPVSRTASALATLEPRFAHAALIVPLQGEASVHVAGRLDAETPFSTWHLVPLGTATCFLLDAALARALAAGTLKLSSPVLHGEAPQTRVVRLGELDACFNARPLALPGYARFVRDPRSLRPVAELVAAHAFPLDRRARFDDSSALQVAIAQLALERATGQAWHTQLAAVAAELGMGSAFDLTRAWPARSVAAGHRADGREFPVRIAEVPAFGNAACSVTDLAVLARHALRSVLEENAAAPATARRFRRVTPPPLLSEFLSFSSSWCGTTLEIDLAPELRTALVVFGARPRGDWSDRLRRAMLAELCGPSPDRIVAVDAEPEFAAAPERPFVGRYRGSLRFEGSPVELEIAPSADGGTLAPVDPARAGGPPRTLCAGDSGWTASLPLPLVRGSPLASRIQLDIPAPAEDGAEIAAVAWLERLTSDGIRIELLPQRVRFRRVGNGRGAGR